MSDIEIILGALPRLRDALRPRRFGVVGASGASEHQLRILSHLDDTDPTMVGELADFMGVTASTMSLNLKRLQASGLVTRTRDPADRRVMNVCLTDLGRSLRDSTPDFDPDRIDAMLLGMRPEDRRRGVEGLALLAEAAGRLEARNIEYVNALTGETRPTGDGGVS